MKKNIYIIIGLLIIVFVAGCFVVVGIFPGQSLRPGIEKANIAGETTAKKVSLVVDSGSGNPKTFVADFKEPMTAFDLLKSGTENLNLKTKEYSIGIMIEAIGDKENGQDGKYWMYYINGKLAGVSADKQKLAADDKVEFRFEKPSF